MNEPRIINYDNPIWFRDRWRIYLSGEGGPNEWYYAHDDLDGNSVDDFRYGYCESVEACKQEIHDRFYSAKALAEIEALDSRREPWHDSNAGDVPVQE